MLGLAGVGGAVGVGAHGLGRGDRLGGVERGAGRGPPVDHVVDAEQRRARRDRAVGAARQHHARVQQRPLAVQP